MAALNVLPPDCLDRVREYALEIVVYIEKIIEKRYVYESNRSVSVYFVVGKFDSSSNHHYAKRKKLFRKLLATLQLLKKLKVLSVQLRVRRDQAETLILKILQINWHFSFSYIYNDKLYRMHIST